MIRHAQLDLSSILAEQNPKIDLRLKVYEASTRNFLKAVINYKNRAVVVLTERRNQQNAEKKRLDDKIQATDSDRNQCKLREIELLAELDKEQEERKTSEHAVSTLKRHLASIREKCRTFDVEVEQYRAVKANLSREKDKERLTLQSHASAISPELNLCQRSLRCVVEGIEKHQILIRLTHIDASDINREFSFVVDVSGQSYKVLTSSPPLPTLPILVTQLNQSRDIYLFIRRIRHWSTSQPLSLGKSLNMNLRYDVLRTRTPDSIDKRHSYLRPNVAQRPENDDSDDELVNVVSLPGTPIRSRPQSRASSPRRGASFRPIPGSLYLPESRQIARDPLKALPTEVSQRVFSYLSVPDLAICALVSKKWNRSQTINYVWFQHYRRENFHDNSLPPGKWTKRESKQNWRTLFLQFSNRHPQQFGKSRNDVHRGSGYSSPSSGYQTPKELREEKWRMEAEAALKPSKVEMRGLYKELGGRKTRGKTKVGSAGIRDKGGWEGDDTSSW